MLTRSNILKLSRNGKYMRATCTVCNGFTDILQKDEFVPFREFNSDGRSFLMRNNKQQLRHFLEIHFGKHKKEAVNVKR